MAKIKEIRAFRLRRVATARAEPMASAAAGDRRRAWIADAEVAGPTARFDRFKRSRATWRPSRPDVGCVVLAEDGSWGFGVSR